MSSLLGIIGYICSSLVFSVAVHPLTLDYYCSLSFFHSKIITLLFFLTLSGTKSTATAGPAHADQTKGGEAEKGERKQEEEKTSKPEDYRQAEGSFPSPPTSPAVPPPSVIPHSSPKPELSAA